MKRRIALVAALTVAAGLATSGAGASASPVATPRGDTNGCVVLIPLELAICLPR